MEQKRRRSRWRFATLAIPALIIVAALEARRPKALKDARGSPVATTEASSRLSKRVTDEPRRLPWRHVGIAIAALLVVLAVVAREAIALEEAHRKVAAVYAAPLNHQDPQARESARRFLTEAREEADGLLARIIALVLPSQQAKISDTQLRMAAIEARIEYAEANARYQSCLATVAQITARSEALRSDCVELRSKHESCRAKKARNFGVGALAGALGALACGTGIGCMALPIIGGAVGHVSKRCGSEPVCASDPIETTRAALGGLGLASVPICAAPCAPVNPPLASAR
jgi:hypothetical protein